MTLGMLSRVKASARRYGPALLYWLWPRPIGWVVLAFWTYAIGRSAQMGRLTVSFVREPFRLEILAAGLAVAVWQLARSYRAVAWPDDRRRVAPVHWALFAVCLLPGLFALANQVAAGGAWIREAFEQDRPSSVPVRAAIPVFRYLALCGLPSVLVWLSLGIYFKTNASLRPLAFVTQSVGRLVDASRDWLAPATLLAGYAFMSGILTGDALRDQDAALARWDRALFFGVDPVDALGRIAWPPLSEWLGFSYSFFAALFPICFAAVYARRSTGAFRELAFAVTLTLAVANITFTLIPVQGPLYTHPFAPDVRGHFFGALQVEFMERGRVPRDCFPSLHTALTLVMGWYVYRYSRRVFWVVSPVVVSTPLACVYFRYHYVVDVLAGIALAAGVLAVSPKVVAWGEAVRGKWRQATSVPSLSPTA
jgi:hypothetical protein